MPLDPVPGGNVRAYGAGTEGNQLMAQAVDSAGVRMGLIVIYTPRRSRLWVPDWQGFFPVAGLGLWPGVASVCAPSLRPGERPPPPLILSLD